MNSRKTAIDKELALRIFSGFTIHRWNDQIRPVELTEMDKHSHKMMIAWLLAKYEERAGRPVDWERVIQGGIFELLRRIALADMKSPVYHRIEQNYPAVHRALNRWVWEQYAGMLGDAELTADFRAFLADGAKFCGAREHAILKAAGRYATVWEFRIIKHANPHGLEIDQAERHLWDIGRFLDLDGMRKLVSRHPAAGFVDLCGQLRFQMRWGNIVRMPQTSVLGHMLLVAVLSYLFARRIGACPRRRYNDFFGGLFHDLPEAVTRDVVNPVKTAVKSLPAALKRIEGELAREMILPLLEPAWHAEFEYFTGREFDDKVRVRGRTVLLGGRGIGARRNRDGCNPYDGRLVQLADQLAAFLEAYKACEMGLSIREMDEARKRIAGQYRGRTVSGIDAGALFAAFEGGRCGRGPGWPRTR